MFFFGLTGKKFSVRQLQGTYGPFLIKTAHYDIYQENCWKCMDLISKFDIRNEQNKQTFCMHMHFIKNVKSKNGFLAICNEKIKVFII